MEGSPSLVGADSLPSESALARETIQIIRGYGDFSIGFLSHELRPDGTVKVTHTDRTEKLVGEEEFRLSSDSADKARRLLRRVRPAKLEGLDAHEARPSGCERQGPHDFGELAVLFIDEGDRAGTGDDRVGMFELPRQESCGTPQAAEARRLVRQVLESLPPSAVAAGFEG